MAGFNIAKFLAYLWGVKLSISDVAKPKSTLLYINRKNIKYEYLNYKKFDECVFMLKLNHSSVRESTSLRYPRNPNWHGLSLKTVGFQLAGLKKANLSGSFY